MTQTGKCGTCRLRKVKCDEEKPKCGACQKKNRPCSYDYGKPTAFVAQDPNQLTKHGRSITSPLVYALDVPNESNSSSSSKTSELRVMTERVVGNGSGMFRTLAPASLTSKARLSKKAEAYQRRKLLAYLRRLQSGSSISSAPSSSETTLIARYIDMIGVGPVNYKPLYILGTWIDSIPSRIGSNRTLDLAVEFLINSYSVYWDDSYSKRRLAEATKAKALAGLQLAVIETQSCPSYDVVLATKTHYAAEAFLGMDTMYHAIHAFGLAEILRMGNITGADEEHFWNLIDNTYVDDVHEAMITGRASVYDNDYYLATTFPPAMSADYPLLSSSQRASLVMMHIFIQCPRLVCLIRNAILDPEAMGSLASAVSLMEYIWQLDLPQHVSGLVKDSITVVYEPVSPEMADILPNSYHYDSIQSMVLCTRYWMLLNLLCGFMDTLHRRFPAEVALSLLPDLETILRLDTDAALDLAKSLGWAESGSKTLPLVPLRLHTPLQLSVGPWLRVSRKNAEILTTIPNLDTQTRYEISRETENAVRMKKWLIEQCNRIHRQWAVSEIDEAQLTEALDAESGEKIPDWLPTRVRFEAEDGNMVMKLDYEREGIPVIEQYSLGEGTPKLLSSGSHGDRDSLVVYELPDRTGSSGITPGLTTTFSDTTDSSPGMDPASRLTNVDFLFASGRNLCQTSGWWPNSSDTSAASFESPTGGPFPASSWWPQTPEVSTGLFEDTNGTSTFQSVQPSEEPGMAAIFDKRHMNACMSSAWNNSSSLFTTTSFDNAKKKPCFSPVRPGET